MGFNGMFKNDLTFNLTLTKLRRRLRRLRLFSFLFFFVDFPEDRLAAVFCYPTPLK